MPEAATTRALFSRTHWSVVWRAKDGAGSGCKQALENLCRTYWPPIYGYIRRKGYAPADAQDLTQDFFARLLEKDSLQHLKHQDAKFRSFLLTLLNHQLNDDWDKRRAQKRGGGKPPLPFDDFAAREAELALEPPARDPALTFDRHWARTVLAQASQRLAEEYRARGKEAVFEALKPRSQDTTAGPAYADLVDQLGMTQEALRKGVERMRVRFGQIIREEVSQTVAKPEEVDEEVRHLIRVLANLQ